MSKSKWCFNYDSGEYEDIDEDGYSWTKHEYVYNWDDSEFRREKEEREEQEENERKQRWRSLFSDDDEDD